MAWQRAGDHADFDALWAVASGLVTRSVRQTFLRAFCRDAASMDEAVALVMDHLRMAPKWRGDTI